MVRKGKAELLGNMTSMPLCTGLSKYRDHSAFIQYIFIDNQLGPRASLILTSVAKVVSQSHKARNRGLGRSPSDSVAASELKPRFSYRQSNPFTLFCCSILITTCNPPPHTHSQLPPSSGCHPSRLPSLPSDWQTYPRNHLRNERARLCHIVLGN